jgi:(p)ppGpp synthase/HD superfamily hydrolase
MPPAPMPVPVILPADARRLGRALEFAAERHGGQARKGTEIPYVSHLLHVAGFVLEHGGDVDQAMAALLHDVVEDCGVRPAELESYFGARVARIVVECTDLLDGDTPEAKSDWLTRKQRYLDHLPTAWPPSWLVSACDKRHNLAALVADLRRHGPAYLGRFNAGGDQQLWFYRAFHAAARSNIPAALAADLASLADQFAALIGSRA